MVHATPGLQAAIAALRQSLATRTPPSTPRTGDRAMPRAASAPTQTAESPASNVATLGVRLAAITQEGHERRKTALRLFIEAVLLDEFGSGLVLDPALQELVDRTAHAIESDHTLNALMDASLRELAASPS